MNYRFHPHAEAELYEAQDWYEERRDGLGLEFLTAVSRAIDRITANPSAYGRWPGSSFDVRVSCCHASRMRSRILWAMALSNSWRSRTRADDRCIG
jgi:hypothetical protein